MPFLPVADADPQAFLNHIDGLYATYNLPIWITEFAVRDGNAATPEDNIYTDQQVYNFMAEVLPGLESRSFVERYAWFHSPRDNAFVTSSALFENNGELTRLGRLYVGEVETIPNGGMLLNPNFESPHLVAPTYSTVGSDDWTTINDAETSAYYAHTGRQSLSLAPGLSSGQSKPGIVRQEFQVGVDVNINERYSLGAWVFHPSDDPLTGTREAPLRIQWFDENNNLLGDQRTVALDANSPTDEWVFVSLDDVLIPNNINIDKVRANLWVNNVGPTSVNSGAAYFDDVIFIQGSRLPIAGDFDLNGRVDGLDFLTWQRGESLLPHSSHDLVAWEFAYSSSAMQTLGTVVPEPSTQMLLALCIALQHNCLFLVRMIRK